MKNIALIFVLGIFFNCRGQNLPNSFKSEIVDFYIFSNEIQNKERQKLINDSYELFTITELGDTKPISEINTNGIYTLKPNISHTTTLLISYDGNKYTLLSSNDVNKTLINALNFLKGYKNCDELCTLEDVGLIIKLMKDNQELSNIDVLEW